MVPLPAFMTKIKAVIFDLNGVVVNDERIHQEAWRQFCGKHNLEISEDEFKDKVFGRTEKDVLNYLFKRGLSRKELEKHSTERTQIAIGLFKPIMKLTAGLEKFLRLLSGGNIPLALATSSRIPYANFILEGLKIRKYFKAVITAEDVRQGKPNPEIYKRVIQRLQVNPADCVVFEDTVSGIKAAKAAGMRVIAITTTHGAKELNLADRIINTFEELTLKDLETLNT